MLELAAVLVYIPRVFAYPEGAVAQLVEHHVRNVGVRGSNPLRSTIPVKRSRRWVSLEQ